MPRAAAPIRPVVPGDPEAAAPIRPECVITDALDRASRVLHAESPDAEALLSCCTPLDRVPLPDLARLFYHLAYDQRRPGRYAALRVEAVAQLDTAIHLHAEGKR